MRNRIQTAKQVVDRVVQIAESEELILSESRRPGSFGHAQQNHGQFIASEIRKQLTPGSAYPPMLDPDNYLWKWVERGLFDSHHRPTDALDIMAYHPSAPWNNGVWDVDHKPYAEAFYKKFPKAKPEIA